MARPDRSCSGACTLPPSPLGSGACCREVGGTATLGALPPSCSLTVCPALLTSLPLPHCNILFPLAYSCPPLAPGIYPCTSAPQRAINPFQQLTHHSPAAHPARLISGQSSTPSTSLLRTPVGPSFVQFSNTFLSCLLAFARAFPLPGTMHCASPPRSQPKHQFFLERWLTH